MWASSDFARACEAAGIIFVGPDADTVDRMGNKTIARELAVAAGVPVVPGTEHAVTKTEEALAFCEKLCVSSLSLCRRVHVFVFVCMYVCVL